ncbi:MAG: hypothetical protein OEZ36_02485, partial [Spirochaetota bacterium]|nr:hypothetical protein [Spirochaetota bacterium]
MDIIILKDEQMMAPQLYETLHSLGYSPQKSQHEIQTSFEIKQDKPLTVLTNDEIKQYLNDVQNS